MFRTFKNLELTRYHMSAKFEKSIAEHTDQSAASSEQILAAVFSAALSLLFTYVLDEKVVSLSLTAIWQKILYALGIAVCYIILFALLFYGFKVVYRRICKIISYKKIHSPNYSSKRIKEIIDDFDIVAYDDLLAAFEFIEHIEGEDVEVTTFYFHELLYYLRTAIEKTQAVLDISVSALTINSKDKVDAVDLFRVYNAYSMMKQISDVIHCIMDGAKIKIQTYDERLKDVLKIQIADIVGDIEAIGSRLTEILQKHYPAGQ